MRSLPSRVLPLALCGLLSLASGCANKGPYFPSPADLTVPPKPILSAYAVYDDSLQAAYDIAIEARGDGLALQVGRLCRYFKVLGQPGLNCPERPEVSNTSGGGPLR